MSKLEDYILSNQPTKLLVREPSLEAIFFLKDGQRTKLDLQNPAEASSFLSTIRLSSLPITEYPSSDEAGRSFEFVFNWAKDEEPSYMQILKRFISIFKKHPITNMAISTSFNNKVETSQGNFSLLFTKEDIEGVYNGIAAEHNGTKGDVMDLLINISGSEYSLSQYRINSEITISISRYFRNFERLKLNCPSEFKHRHKLLESGSIITSFHPVIKMEHIIPTIIDLDVRAAELTCSIGQNLISTRLPVVSADKDISYLKSLHYKYFIFGIIKDAKDLETCLSLIYEGKTVILGFEATSIYGCFMKLMSLIGDNYVNVSRHLSSCIGLVYPHMSIEDDLLSLDNSEFTTLSDTRVKEIASGEFSRYAFMSYVERSSKSFKLNNTNTDLSPKEEFDSLLISSVKMRATDVFLAVNSVPKFKIDNVVSSDYSRTPLSADTLNNIISFLLEDDKNKHELLEKGSTSIPYPVKGVGRFRVQIIKQRGTSYCAIRFTPFEIPSAVEMKIPAILITQLKKIRRGLIVTSGKPGTGKSTTNNIFLDILSKESPKIMHSIADPIEYIHSHGDGIFTQVEVPTDSPTFTDAMVDAMRLTVDVVEIAETREEESADPLFRLIDSGVVTITSTHSESVIATLDYLSNLVGPTKRDKALKALATRSQMLINQRLMPGLKRSLVCAFEYLIPTDATRSLMERADFNQLVTYMKNGSLGKKDFATWGDYEVIELFLQREISREVMEQQVTDKAAIEDNLKIVADARGLKIP